MTNPVPPVPTPPPVPPKDPTVDGVPRQTGGGDGPVPAILVRKAQPGAPRRSWWVRLWWWLMG